MTSESELLSLVFKALGSNARPLFPELKDEFQAGRSLAPCVAGFCCIGGTDCGLVLVEGLASTNKFICNYALSGISSFSTNSDVAAAA